MSCWRWICVEFSFYHSCWCLKSIPVGGFKHLYIVFSTIPGMSRMSGWDDFRIFFVCEKGNKSPDRIELCTLIIAMNILLLLLPWRNHHPLTSINLGYHPLGTIRGWHVLTPEASHCPNMSQLRCRCHAGSHEPLRGAGGVEGHVVLMSGEGGL